MAKIIGVPTNDSRQRLHGPMRAAVEAQSGDRAWYVYVAAPLGDKTPEDYDVCSAAVKAALMKLREGMRRRKKQT